MTPAIARISTPRGRVRRKNFRGGNDAPTAPLTAMSVRLPKPVRITPSRIRRCLQISWIDSRSSSPYASRTTTISPARAPPATIRSAAIVPSLFIEKELHFAEELDPVLFHDDRV